MCSVSVSAMKNCHKPFQNKLTGVSLCAISAMKSELFQNPSRCALAFLAFGVTGKLEGAGVRSQLSVAQVVSSSLHLLDSSWSSHLLHSLFTSSNWEGQESFSVLPPSLRNTASRSNCIPVLCTGGLSLTEEETRLRFKH